MVLPSAERLCRMTFRGWKAPALFAGSAAHSGLPLHKLGTAAYGIMLNMLGHAVGWPLPRGGAGEITRAMAACIRSFRTN